MCSENANNRSQQDKVNRERCIDRQFRYAETFVGQSIMNFKANIFSTYLLDIEMGLHICEWACWYWPLTSDRLEGYAKLYKCLPFLKYAHLFLISIAREAEAEGMQFFSKVLETVVRETVGDIVCGALEKMLNVISSAVDSTAETALLVDTWSWFIWTAPASNMFLLFYFQCASN